MTLSKPIAALLLVLGLAGCTTAESCLNDGRPRRSPAPDAGTQTKDLYLDDATLFRGVAWEYQCGDRPGSMRLKSVRDKRSGQVEHQLIVNRHYQATGWHYYHTAAALEPDEPLRLHQVERQVGQCDRISWMGCHHWEEVAVDLPEPLLVAATEKARLIRFTSKDGRHGFSVWLTPEQASEHLDTIRATPLK